MAHLIPILQDILPIFRPGKVQVVRSTTLHEGTGQTEGMIRKGAIVGMSDHICASVMIAKPHTSSAVHHHGEQDTIVYAASGHGSIITNPSLITPAETPNPTTPSAPEALTQLELDDASNAMYSPSHDNSSAIHPHTANLALNSNPNESSDTSTTITTTAASPAPLTVVHPDPYTSPITLSTPNPLSPSSIPSAPQPTTILSPNFPTGAPPAHSLPTFLTTAATTTTSRKKGLHKHTLAPGDFALIPAWTEHQEVNDSDADVVWIITRSGSKPVVVNLSGWGGKEV